jgi:hypothetical protein
MTLHVTHTTRITLGLFDDNNKMEVCGKGSGRGPILIYCDMMPKRRKCAV